jgi:hypothetical protein
MNDVMDVNTFPRYVSFADLLEISRNIDGTKILLTEAGNRLDEDWMRNFRKIDP